MQVILPIQLKPVLQKTHMLFRGLKENALSKNHFYCHLFQVQLCTDWTTTTLLSVQGVCVLNNRADAFDRLLIEFRTSRATAYIYPGYIKISNGIAPKCTRIIEMSQQTMCLEMNLFHTGVLEGNEI